MREYETRLDTRGYSPEMAMMTVLGAIQRAAQENGDTLGTVAVEQDGVILVAKAAARNIRRCTSEDPPHAQPRP